MNLVVEIVGYRWVGVMGGGTEHGAYETHVLMRNPKFEDVCRAHPIAAMWCSHFTFPFWSWGSFPFPFLPPPRPPIQRKFGVVLLGTPQMHLLALLLVRAARTEYGFLPTASQNPGGTLQQPHRTQGVPYSGHPDTRGTLQRRPQDRRGTLQRRHPVGVIVGQITNNY